jgi:hypothetical protein
MKKLKAQFRKKTPKIIKKKKLSKIVKKKKLGRWCEYYLGRLPYPIECSNNKSMPVSTIFKDGKPTIIRNYPNCKYCDRNPSFISWKRGDWKHIIQAIADGEDLRNMPSPN